MIRPPRAKEYGLPVSWGAHRVAWFLYSGRIPGDLDVLHRCDVPSCVNFRHLFLGTQSDNAKDMWSKGRSRPGHAKPGEQHHSSKLSKADVIDIRYQVSNGVQQKVMAEKYNMSKAQVSRIVTGKRWAHVKGN